MNLKISISISLDIRYSYLNLHFSTAGSISSPRREIKMNYGFANWSFNWSCPSFDATTLVEGMWTRNTWGVANFSWDNIAVQWWTVNLSSSGQKIRPFIRKKMLWETVEHVKIYVIYNTITPNICFTSDIFDDFHVSNPLRDIFILYLQFTYILKSYSLEQDFIINSKEIRMHVGHLCKQERWKTLNESVDSRKEFINDKNYGRLFHFSQISNNSIIVLQCTADIFSYLFGNHSVNRTK